MFVKVIHTQAFLLTFALLRSAQAKRQANQREARLSGWIKPLGGKLLAQISLVILASYLAPPPCGADEGELNRNDRKIGLSEAEPTIKLLPPEGNKIYFGAFPDFGEEEEIVTTERIQNFENLAAKKIAWAAFSQYWYKGMEYPKQAIHTIHAENIIPLIRMHPRSSEKEYIKESKYTLSNIIEGAFDRELSQWAREAKADGIPLLVDFGVEMNGKWFPWNGYWNGGGNSKEYGDPSYPDGPERYRDAYRHLIDLFRREQVRHITWIFHPTMYLREPKANWNHPKWYYPGDDYIDWIGVSIYGALYPRQNYWDTYTEILEEDNAYKRIAEISKTKPLAILELGVTDHHPLGSKSEWLVDALDKIKENQLLEFQAVTYWHENWDNDGSTTSLRIDSSQNSLSAFRQSIQDPRFISDSRFSGQEK